MVMDRDSEQNLFQKKKDRIQSMRELIQSSGSITVNELSLQFNCSEQTIRRDLQFLESLGEIKRTYGEVFYVGNLEDVGEPFDKRLNKNVDAKKDIARRAAALVSPGLTIAIDSSTSGFYFAQALPDINLTIVTNSFTIADFLIKKEKYLVICIGGTLDPIHKDLVLPKTTTPTNIDEMVIDMSFISCTSLDLYKGVYDMNQWLVNIKKLIIQRSNRVVLLADYSKFNKKTKFQICSWSDIDFIVPENALDNESRRRIHELNINLI